MAKYPLTVRLTPEGRAALLRLAQREDRSASSMIEILIKREAIDRGVYAPAAPRAIKAKD